MRIFTVGLELPGESFEFINFDSHQTLLDADVILFEPTVEPCRIDNSWSGRDSLDEETSFQAKANLDHWRSEISQAVQAGRLVIVFLNTPLEYNRKTGEKQYSGTGKNARTTNIVTNMSSYEAVPFLGQVVPKKGTSVRLTKQAQFLRPYWDEVSNHSQYKAEIRGEFSHELLVSKVGDRIVGAVVFNGDGALLFLPPIDLECDEFVAYGEDGVRWTAAAMEFGNRILGSIVSLAKSLKNSLNVTPAPNWASAPEFQMNDEAKIKSEIDQFTAEIKDRKSKLSILQGDLQRAGSLRALLYEQGAILESSIIEALHYLGFEAEPYDNGISEFDAVFSSEEGRCLGEAEGKQRHAINVDKMSQLERNIAEDFERDEVTEHAKPVLFGNASRLLPLSKRSDFFTAKCISSAERAGAALVRTPDLFGPARYLRENREDTEYASACRLAIFSAEGTIVEFPDPPERSSPMGSKTIEQATT